MGSVLSEYVHDRDAKVRIRKIWVQMTSIRFKLITQRTQIKREIREYGELKREIPKEAPSEIDRVER